ncbi:hypothetical protein ZWY2020_003658 [Hordeum vulgare]|nr:hypothetical protein ZWY2020_003658 [Hordeum vulgare]
MAGPTTTTLRPPSATSASSISPGSSSRTASPGTTSSPISPPPTTGRTAAATPTSGASTSVSTASPFSARQPYKPTVTCAALQFMEMWILLQFHGRDMLSSNVSAAMWEADAHKHEVKHVKQQFQQGNRQKWTQTIVHILQDSPPPGSPLMRGGAVVEVTK